MPLLAAAALAIGLLSPHAAAAAIFTVNDDAVGPGPAGAECSTPDFASIQDAVASPSVLAGNTIRVCAGTYGPVILNKSLKLFGAQTGVDARGRSGPESVIAAAVGTLLQLDTPAAGSTIDGFHLSGGAVGLDSQSGPLDGITFANNKMTGFTGNGITIDHTGADITLATNVVDGASKVGGGNLIQLGSVDLDGFRLIDNQIVNGTTATGLFSDGNHTIGASASRAPRIAGNLFDGQIVGANLGSRSFEFGEITGNTFNNANFDGLQGGIQNSTISGNRFTENGRSGLALTSFGNMGLDRGAQATEVSGNVFSGNTSEAIFLSATQAVGTISTNEIHLNRIAGVEGITYNGGEAIDAENNWWGCNEGPGAPGCSTAGATVDADPWLVLGISANPATVALEGSSQVAAALTGNSDGVVVGPGFPDGTDVGFTTSLGAVQSPVPTVSGQAVSAFTAGTVPGTANVVAALDGESVSAPVVIEAPDPGPGPDPVPCSNVIRGSKKANKLVGTEGSDQINGLGAADKIRGLAGEDCLVGGSGADRIKGGADADEISGGRGNDRIQARDGVSELILCGKGNEDRVVADEDDQLRGCEQVKRPEI